MKKIVGVVLFLCSCSVLSQEKERYSLEAHYFFGNILEHNPNISHLITGYPEGVILGFNRKTSGKKDWEARYIYPDVGYSFIYQDMKNPYLGNNYSLYGHLAFYFLNRNLQLKVGQGLAFNTNPYHAHDNYINNAYGSRLMSSTFFSGTFYRENFFKGFGLQAGVSFIHYSNADFKSPNNGTNTITFNVGVNYLFDHAEPIVYLPASEEDLSEPIHLNLAVRSGVNTLGIIGSSSYPFLTFSAYADKRLNGKSTLQAGTEIFLSRALEEYITYQAETFPGTGTRGDEDSRRVGIFAGHQLTFDRLSVISQAGYYLYYPYDKFGKRIYLRLGLQRSIYRKVFASATVRAHWQDAEAVEFSLGYRL